MNFFCTASAFFINTGSQPVYSLHRLNFLLSFHQFTDRSRNKESAERQFSFTTRLLYQLLVLLNRSYAKKMHCKVIPISIPFFFVSVSTGKEFSSHHRVADYLQLLRVSPAQLNKFCRLYMGITAQQMIHHKQISEAKRLLRATTDTCCRYCLPASFQ